MSVIVNWKGQRFDVPFNEDVQRAAKAGDKSTHAWAKRATLGDLLNKCAQGSKVPKENIKLLHGGGVPFVEELEGLPETWWDSALRSWGTWLNGGGSSERISGSFALMKDLTAPLSSYGIRTGSKIMMIGDNASAPLQPPQPQPTKRSRPEQTNAKSSRPFSQPQPHSHSSHTHHNHHHPTPSPPPSAHPPQEDGGPEEVLIATIDSHLSHVAETALPLVHDYCAQAASYIDTATPESTPPKQLRDLHAKAAEVLLQRLLKLDGVMCEPHMDRARAKRKEAVKYIQGQLDKIDALKEKVRDAAANAGPSL
ncbi:hypothetical protein PhCBS80983_g05379 [Powellomyces hirtus]|uniref:BAG domain-containing protein n=1 Tax=Powellomyces hirtus TaxID=109895 RepID=A0A507DUD0_9FUNG|nr:hypothetical protein PhCBS80983_g05379 [Powellomyces hirtus]